MFMRMLSQRALIGYQRKISCRQLLYQIELSCQLDIADRLPGIFGNKANDNVAQLSYVAREMVVKPALLGFLVQTEGLLASLTRIKIAEMFKQQIAVFLQISQRRNTDGKDTQAMVEIDTEAA